MEERIEKRIPSVIPYYSCGMVWVLYALVFPMYRMIDFLLVGSSSLAVFLVLRKMIPPKIVVEYRPISTGDSQLDAMLSQGKTFISDLMQMRQDISNRAIQTQIDRMIASSQKIFEQVQRSPQKLSSIRRFMNYYLPTITKLLQSYDNMENQNMAAKSIHESMLGIEVVMGQAADAFDRQLENLFASDTIDIASEIKVLEHMIRRQGLFQSEFETGKEDTQ